MPDTTKQYSGPVDVEEYLLGLGFDPTLAYEASLSAGVDDALTDPTTSPEQRSEDVEEVAQRVAGNMTRLAWEQFDSDQQ
jgi:hypothetical protein